ncbi:MAG: DNA gyrase inhibitor YacG [Alphaproteobacteria bacterium]|jgi:hypothetical protein|nr:DNA gyrase inhibitor YacG [Alphaproteobacteria bacterium]MDP6237215.1 DNA gyrase inhibitor YacG [Alphaproteobacteria bacterium]MDP7172393.1 DNA gyrase inhibitor YacG [Alphaproteobacteria bacterium]MDP7234339.1 DNA gyrase inhibitor YacG [Alphaproteobacteria bacterium]MDP7487988.1 DNA gyrase inhibitor YacG [Alphaproteobacteria bacterium]
MSDKPGYTPAVVEGRVRGRSCSICDKSAAAVQYPFCSQRCRDVDLGRWLKGSYAIPSHISDLGVDDDG